MPATVLMGARGRGVWPSCKLLVKGGGHGFTSGCARDDPVVLDLSRFTAMTRDVEARVAQAGGGLVDGLVGRAVAY